MARKNRVPEVSLPTNEPKEKAQYQDAFTTTLNKPFEEFGKAVDGKGRTLLYGLGAVAVVLILVGIFVSWSRGSDAKAQTALGKAIETSQAVVSESPMPAGSTIKTFKTEKERAEAAVAELQAVADKFGGAVGEKAKFLAATNKLSIDRAAATSDLEGMSKGSGDVATLAKFALAQVKAADGKTDEAVELYKSLAATDSQVLAKDVVNFELAKLYEKQGKKDDAVAIYLTIAKAAAEAKDLDGKPVSMTATASDAKKKVEELAPDKAKEIPEVKPESPFGGGFPGMQ